MVDHGHVEALYLYAGTVINGEDDLHSYAGKLYHYTNSSGLLGILESQKLWATEASYLNDSNEVEYGLAAVADELRKIVCEEYAEPKKIILSEALVALQTKHEEIYVACLSEDGDLLSQWKGYADFGSGFAIELDCTELPKRKRKHQFFDITISRVIYDRVKQSQVVRDEVIAVLSEYERSVSAHPESALEIGDAAVHVMATILRHKALWFKSAVFEEEREWRAVLPNPSTFAFEGRVPAKFRVVNGSLVPYMEFDLGPSAQKTRWQLPISSIVLGSKVNRLRAEKSIALLYKNMQVDPPPTRISRIPLQ